MRCLGLPVNPFSYKTCTVLKRYKSFNHNPQQCVTAAGELVYINVIYLTLISIKGVKYAITFTNNYTK
jgi:hypothetical protein